MKNKEQSEKATRDSVGKEMAKPRVTRSARIAQLNLDADRIPGPPSTTMQGTVVQIITSRRTGKPILAQIALDVPEKQHRDFRIEK